MSFYQLFIKIHKKYLCPNFLFIDCLFRSIKNTFVHNCNKISMLTRFFGVWATNTLTCVGGEGCPWSSGEKMVNTLCTIIHKEQQIICLFHFSSLHNNSKTNVLTMDLWGEKRGKNSVCNESVTEREIAPYNLQESEEQGIKYSHNKTTNSPRNMRTAKLCVCVCVDSHHVPCKVLKDF